MNKRLNKVGNKSNNISSHRPIISKEQRFGWAVEMEEIDKTAAITR